MALVVIAAVATIGYLQNRLAPPLAPTWKGRVNYVLLCRSASPGRPGLDLAGVSDDLTFQNWPVRLELTAVVSILPDRLGRQYRLVKIDRSDPTPRAQDRVFHERPGRVAVTVHPLPPFEVAKPGTITFQLHCDGEEIAERVLTVSASTTTRPADSPPRASNASRGINARPSGGTVQRLLKCSQRSTK